MSVIALLVWLKPSWLRLVYVGWMCLAFPVGWLVSHLLLGGIYFLGMTPTGWIMRLGGYDPLQRQPDTSRESYWESRPETHEPGRYFRQF